jgi:hypothetical protein
MEMTDLLWLLWIGAFFAIEIPNLRDKKEGGTLSELGWKLGNIRAVKANKRTWVGRVIFLLFGTWLTTHFAFGWFTASNPWPF